MVFLSANYPRALGHSHWRGTRRTPSCNSVYFRTHKKHIFIISSSSFAKNGLYFKNCSHNFSEGDTYWCSLVSNPCWLTCKDDSVSDTLSYTHTWRSSRRTAEPHVLFFWTFSVSVLQHSIHNSQDYSGIFQCQTSTNFLCSALLSFYLSLWFFFLDEVVLVMMKL